MKPVEQSIRIAARPATVWQFLVEPDGLAEWWGRAEVDPRPGGTFRVQMDDGPDPVMLGTVVEFLPPERLVVTFGWEPTEGAPPLPPGASTLEITLTPDGNGTLLHLRHTGLPPNLESETHQGWLDSLARLRQATETPP